MLLRTSSTPISCFLHSCLSSSLPHISSDLDSEPDPPHPPPSCFKSFHPPPPALLSPPPPLHPHASPHHNASPPLQPTPPPPAQNGSPDVPRNLDSCTSMRRARSENDLALLANDVPPHKSAVDPLLGSLSEENANVPDHLSTPHRKWSRRLSLMKHSGMSCQLHNRSHGVGKKDPIRKVSDFIASGPHDDSDGDSAGDAGAPAISSVSLFKENCSGLESPERKARVELDKAQDVEGASALVNTCKGNPQTAVTRIESSVSGRPTYGFGMEDGEVYTSYKIGANGVPVVCNSRGCRPLSEAERLSPMYIAGGLGLGIGGGGHGGAGNKGHGAGYGADSNRTEAYYTRLLQEDPQNPLLMRNFARFLLEVRHDYKRAEEYYHRAILADPGDGDVLSQYAKFVWDVHKDQGRAEDYYEQAVQATPEDCYVLASYASFLWDSYDNEQNHSSCSQSPSTMKGVAHGPAPVVLSA